MSYNSIHTGTEIDNAISRVQNNEDFTSTEKSKLATVATGAEVNSVNSVNGKTGIVTINASELEIGNQINSLRYVKTNGDDADSGYSFDTAKLTIQACIDSITDATVDKQYTIIVACGVYNEQINLKTKPYIHINFEGETVANKIYSESSPTVYLPDSGECRIEGCKLELNNPTVTGGVVVYSSGGSGSFELRLTSTRVVNSNPNIYARNIEVNCDELRVLRSDIFHSNTATDVITTNYNLIDIKGSTTFIGQSLAVTASIAHAGTSTIKMFNFDTDNQTLTTTTIYNLIMTNALFEGIVYGFDYTKNSTSKNTTSNGTITISATSGVKCSAFRVSAPSSQIVDINASSISTSGFDNNYVGETTNSGNVLNLNFIPINTASEILENNGIINKNVLKDGEYRTNTSIVSEKLILGSPTNYTLESISSTSLNAGWISGGDITDNGDGTINIASGEGIIRTSNSPLAQALSFDWAESTNITLTDVSENYVCISYNSGSPSVYVTTDSSIVLNNENDIFELWEVYRDGIDLHITPHKQIANDISSLFQKYIYDFYKLRRPDDGGLILGTTGLNVTITDGVMWLKGNKIELDALDTSGADTFDTYYKTNGVWTKTAGVSNFDNVYYNDITSGLVAYGSGKYGFMDFYIEADSGFVAVYGTAQYTAISAAETADLVDTPPRLNSHGLYVGRVVVQQGVASSPYVSSLTSSYTGSVVTSGGTLVIVNGLVTNVI